MQREILVHGFDDQAIAIIVRKRHVVRMLQRYLAGQVSEIELSNWAFLVFALAAFVPEGRTDDDRWKNGEGPVWQVLQKLATPHIFAPLELEAVRGYLAWIRASEPSELGKQCSRCIRSSS